MRKRRKITLEKYLEIVKRLRINTEAVHWRVPNRYKHLVQKALKELFDNYGTASGKPRQTCGIDGCCNPMHYIQGIENDLIPTSLDEILELTEMVNVNELKDLGFDSYLELFNKDNPLPAKKSDFFIACNRKLRRKNLPPLPDSVLLEIR